MPTSTTGKGAQSGHADDAAEVRASAREGEPDRYLAALLAPDRARPGLLALAAFVRMGIVASQLDASPDFGATARWLAPAAWLAAALLAVLAWRMLRASRAAGPIAALIGGGRAPAQ